MLYVAQKAVAEPAGRLTKQRKVTSGTCTVQRTASEVRPIKLRCTVSQEQLADNHMPTSASSILIEVGTQGLFASLSDLKKSQTRGQRMIDDRPNVFKVTSHHAWSHRKETSRFRTILVKSMWLEICTAIYSGHVQWKSCTAMYSKS